MIFTYKETRTGQWAGKVFEIELRSDEFPVHLFQCLDEFMGQTAKKVVHRDGWIWQSEEYAVAARALGESLVELVMIHYQPPAAILPASLKELMVRKAERDELYYELQLSDIEFLSDLSECAVRC